MRSYIDKYAYKNATSTDLWYVLEEQSKLPVTGLMKSWVNQSGYPILRTTLEEDILFIQQEQFLLSKKKKSHQWIIPVSLSVYQDNKVQTVDLSVETVKFEKKLEIDTNARNAYYFINEEAIGFYRVLYDKQNLTRILERSSKLTSNQKFVLINDYFAFFTTQIVHLKRYFDIILSFKEELSFLVVTTIIQQLLNLQLYLNEEFFEKIKPLGKEYLQSILEVIKLNPQEYDSEEYVKIRSKMIFPLYLYGVEGIIEFGVNNYHKILENEQVDSNSILGCLQIGAQELGDIDKLIQKYIEEEREEMRDKYLLALTWVNYNDSNKILEFSLNQLLERHIGRFFSYLKDNKTFYKVLFPFLKNNLTYFTQKNYIIQQLVLYFILSTSKVKRSELMEFINVLKEKYPKHIKMLDLIEEEIDLYQTLYALKSII